VRKKVSYLNSLRLNVQHELDQLVAMSEHLDAKTFELKQTPICDMRPGKDGYKTFAEILGEAKATNKAYVNQVKLFEKVLDNYREFF
jgi:hypothetical protein